MKRKTFTICYQITGGVVIDAETEDEALRIFNELDLQTLYEEAGDAEVTEIGEDISDIGELEPSDDELEMGFDPYMGCYSNDC